MNVLIVCGGTGGHFYPGIAVAEELGERGHRVMLLVSEKRVDQVAMRDAPDFPVQRLPAVGWGGWRPDRVFRFGAGMGKSLARMRRIFREFHPSAVLGMGGFSSVAPLLLARLHGIPSCVHESNAIAGKANRLAARLATRVAVGLQAAQKWFPAGKTVWTGTPVRRVLREKRDRREARKALGLSENLFTALVMGGSQGARALNRLVPEAAATFAWNSIQWIHLAGEGDEVNVRQAYARGCGTAKVFGFCHDMAALYAAADFAIARSGAASLAEIAHAGLPSILIPFPFASDRHQLANARHFAEMGAAIVGEEVEMPPHRLAAHVRDLMTDMALRRSMAEATKGLRDEDAHRKIADLVERLAAPRTEQEPLS